LSMFFCRVSGSCSLLAVVFACPFHTSCLAATSYMSRVTVPMLIVVLAAVPIPPPYRRAL
jgi:hypothetical protein